jgi:phosphatidylinositol 4-kinase
VAWLVTPCLLLSLDEPLHLQILTSLATNLAQTSSAAASNKETPSQDEGVIDVLLRGLPSTDDAPNGYVTDEGDEAEEWVRPVN